MRSVLCLVALLAAPQLASAALIFESTPVPDGGDIGGVGLGAQYLGSRFELTETTAITSVGGHIWSETGTLFAAIVPLASFSALPASSDIESIAVASATFSGTHPSSVVDVALSATLGPGVYGLVFGGNGGGAAPFGATGIGAMAFGPGFGGSYFYRSVDGTWFNNGITAIYFSVSGDRVPAAPVPEPATLWLLGAGLLLAGGLAKRRKAC